jgi:hypothetical protein
MARRAAADYASMDRANRKPIPAAAFEVDRWASRGGSDRFFVRRPPLERKETTMTTTERDQEIDDRLAPRLRK